MDSAKSIKNAASRTLWGIIFSRLSGLVRNLALKVFLGPVFFSSGFMVSFGFLNFFRRFFGETTMQAGFVPYFEKLRSHTPHLAAQFYRDLLYSLFLLLVLLAGFFELVLYLLGLVLPSWEFLPYLQLILPGLIFLCLYSLNSSLLQCQKIYFLPAVAPLFFNLTWIFALLFLRGREICRQTELLSLAVVLGFFLQWLFTMFPAFKFFQEYLKKEEFFRPRLFSGELRALLKPIFLGIIGVSAMQLNTFLDPLFARIADSASPVYLWYASRVFQLPMVLLGVALFGAVLPPLARAVENNEPEVFRVFLSFAIKRSVAVMVSATFFLFVFGLAALNLFFGYANFSFPAALHTLYCLWGFGLALVPAALVLISAAAFYAKRNYFVPTMAAILSVSLNLLLNLLFVFVFKFQAVWVALASSGSSVFNLYLLVRVMQHGHRPLLDIKIVRVGLKTALCNLGAALIVFLISAYAFQDPLFCLFLKRNCHLVLPSSFLFGLGRFALLAVVYLAVLIFLAYLLNVEEILETAKISRRSFKKKPPPV
ncbi:MAG: lipid II flippase MurJ [Parachlamydiales bacterium]